MLEVVAQGYNWDDYNIQVDALEERMQEGQNGRLIFSIDRRLSAEELEELKDSIEHEGVTIFDVRQEGNVVTADFQKNLWPLLIMGGLLLVPLMGFGWKLMFQNTETTFQQVVKYVIVPIGVVTIVGMVLYMALRKPGDQGQIGVQGYGIQYGGKF